MRKVPQKDNHCGTIEVPQKEDFIMAKQHDKQFKLDAVQYYLDHRELSIRGCAQNLGVGYSTLTKWLKDFPSPWIW